MTNTPAHSLDGDLDDNNDDDLGPTGVIDPLALAPLSSAEMASLRSPTPDHGEPREAALEEQTAELSLPTQPDDVNVLPRANDERRFLHRHR